MCYFRCRCLTDITECDTGYSIAIWIKTPLSFKKNTRYILSSGGQTRSVITGGMSMSIEDEAIVFMFRIRDVALWQITGIGIENDQWYHVAATWNIDGNLTAYLNGIQNGQADPGTYEQTNPKTSSVMYLGRPNRNDEKYSNVSLDEMFFWPRVLTSEEVKIVHSMYFMQKIKVY